MSGVSRPVGGAASGGIGVTLDALPLFAGLSAEQLTQLRSLWHPLTTPAGTTLMTAEQPGEFAYLVLQGTLKVYLLQEDGSEVILALLGPGEMVGELSMVDQLGRSASVVVLEPASLLWIHRADLERCLDTIPALTRNLLRLFARRLRLANVQIQSLARLDIDGRVARQLLAFAGAYGEPAPNGAVRIPLRLTQGDLAALVGASRVRVNQVLMHYKEHRFIADDPQHHITVLDRAALAQRSR